MSRIKLKTDNTENKKAGTSPAVITIVIILAFTLFFGFLFFISLMSKIDISNSKVKELMKDQIADISLTNVTSESATLTIETKDDRELMTGGNNFFLYEKTFGGWKLMNSENTISGSVGTVYVSSQNSYEYTIVFTENYGTLKPGKYLLVKTVGERLDDSPVSNERHKLYCTFEVK